MIGCDLHSGLCFCSDMYDLLKWYNTFLTQPELVGLTKQSLAALTEPLEPVNVPGLLVKASFAQGIVVEPAPGKGKKVRCCLFVSTLPETAPIWHGFPP